MKQKGRNLKNIRASTGFIKQGFIKQASSFQLLKLETYCDDHSSLSSTTAAQYAFHISFTLSNELMLTVELPP